MKVISDIRIYKSKVEKIEGNLNIEGRQEEEFKTVIEIEIKCKL